MTKSLKLFKMQLFVSRHQVNFGEKIEPLLVKKSINKRILESFI